VRATLNWRAVSIGVILGALALLRLATFPISESPFSDNWPFLVPAGLYASVCLFGSFSGLRNRGKAAAVFLLAVPAWIIVLLWLVYRAFVLTDGFVLLPLVFLALSIPTLLGLFWLLTHRAGWGTMLHAQRRSPLRSRLGKLLIAFFLFVTVSLAAASLESIRGYLDCGELPPFVKVQYPHQVAFVAKVLTEHSRGIFPGALAVVEERFWDLHWWERRIVVLSGRFTPGKRYFIDGTHWQGFLTEFFPIIAPTPCGHSSLAKDSIEIRLLRNGVPQGSVRIIGTVRTVDGFGSVPNTHVLVKGPAGTVVKATDAEGILDFTALPPGLYRVEIAPPNPSRSRCGTKNLGPGEVWGCTLYR
jgi:hypothetical protein